MAKKSKQTLSAEFPNYYKITTIAVAIVSFYAMFLVAMETYAAK